jgi:hypothetical protein
MKQLTLMLLNQKVSATLQRLVILLILSVQKYN